jgi:outer membrane protein assembly factor BamB
MKKILTVIIIGLLCCSAFSVFAPQVKASNVTSYPWSMFRHDSGHTGFSPSSAPNTNNIFWTFQIGGRIISSPAVADGKVFVGSMDNNATYALDQSAGTLLWSSQLDERIWGSPSVDGGNVFITDNSKLYALNESTGTRAWTRGFGYMSLLCSSAVAKDNIVFVGSDGGGIFALDQMTGSIIWNYSGLRICSTPAITDNMIFAVSFAQNAKIYCLEEFTGELVWSKDVSQISDGSYFSSPTVSDGMIIVGLNAVASDVGTILALDEYSGATIWSQQIGHIFSSPAVAYGKVFVGSYDKKVYAFDELTGNLAWTYTTGDRIEMSSPAVADSKVFIGSDDHNVYALDATIGTKMWNYTTGHWVDSSPAVSDGVVYVGSLDGKVYAFGQSTTYLGIYSITAYAYPEEADDEYFPDSARRTTIQIAEKDGSVIEVDVKMPFYKAMRMNGGGLVNENPQGYNHLVKWTTKGRNFEEIDKVVGSQGRELVPYQSIAIGSSGQLQYGDKGYFVIIGTGEKYQFSADDTCPAAGKKNLVDLWLGVGKGAYDEALNWGRKNSDLYKYV